MIKLFPTSLLVDANILIRSTFNQGPNHFLPKNTYQKSVETEIKGCCKNGYKNARNTLT